MCAADARSVCDSQVLVTGGIGLSTMSWPSCVAPRLSLTKYKIADGGHIEFCKNANICVADKALHQIWCKYAQRPEMTN